MIQNPTPERHETLEVALNEGMPTSGLYDCRLKVFYQGRLGDSGLPVARALPIVIGIRDARDYCQCIYWERHMFMGSYLQKEFGSGTFEVGLYDENNSELGRFRYCIGGAPEYIHPSEEADYEDGEPKDPAVELFMMLLRERFLGEDEI